MGRSAQLRERPDLNRSREGASLPRRSASQHELARIELLAGLPGETLARLGQRLEREEVAPGTVLVREDEADDRFFVVLSGVLAVSQRDLGARGVLRPGDYFGEVAPAMDMPRTATVSAMTPAVVASCDRATFDELLRPLFADD
jgi:ATP-binding cassette, subfamily B, bacterial